MTGSLDPKRNPEQTVSASMPTCVPLLRPPATGVRLHAGRQATVLNIIISEMPADHPVQASLGEGGRGGQGPGRAGGWFGGGRRKPRTCTCLPHEMDLAHHLHRHCCRTAGWGSAMSSRPCRLQRHHTVYLCCFAILCCPLPRAPTPTPLGGGRHGCMHLPGCAPTRLPTNAPMRMLVGTFAPGPSPTPPTQGHTCHPHASH